ncbi:MAG TPA: glycosyltransferase [Candidatus Binatia bacterium]|nr:glycosyltransferase [Candidatus Binatia bacterium]
MNTLSGKKALCFIALPHHNRFLVPIMEALQVEGMRVIYFTAAAEGAFEITLNQANLPYRHVLDYADEQTRSRAFNGFMELRSSWQEKILHHHTFQSVPVVIQDKVIRAAVENYHTLDRMLEVEQPDLLFALHELNPWGKILGYLSHVHRVPYFTLQEGLYYADTHYYRFHTDFSTACLVWGEACRRTLLKAGCGNDKIYPVGNTHIWGAKTEATSSQSVGEIRATLGIGPEKKIILFLMSHSHYQPFDARVFLEWMKRRGDVVALFKWHPVTSKDIVARALERVPKDAPVINVPEFDTYRLIGASDICITVGNSTTGLESIAFGKPLIECRLPDQAYSFVEQGVAEPALGFEDMGEKCEAIMSHGLPAARRREVEKYLADNFAHQDDRTMKRIIELVSESLAARRNGDALEQRINTASGVDFPCSILLPVNDGPPEALLATLASIAEKTAGEIYEVIVVDCSTLQEIKELLSALAGDVRIIPGQPQWSYGEACNRAAAHALGAYLTFLKTGLLLKQAWLEGLLETAKSGLDTGVVGGMILNENGLIWHIGTAFDVNQSPFSIYRLMPPEFSGARRTRSFRALETPFLVSRELFCRLGGFSSEFSNRFEDIDFCLRVQRKTGLRALYTPASAVTRQEVSWHATDKQNRLNRIRFYSKWTGFVWQDDESYLREDGLTHDALSALYRELAGRVADGAWRASNPPSPGLQMPF